MLSGSLIIAVLSTSLALVEVEAFAPWRNKIAVRFTQRDHNLSVFRNAYHTNRNRSVRDPKAHDRKEAWHKGKAKADSQDGNGNDASKSKCTGNSIIPDAPPLASRRKLLAAALSSTALVTCTATAAWAKSELDKQSGQLFVPKKSMLGGGGSDETRGISLRVLDRSEAQSTTTGKGRRQVLSRSLGEPIQTVYETRFIAYLTRFLFNFDPAAKAWWGNNLPDDPEAQALRFAEFAESVEVGLADYFCGPYGSYASVLAATAGLTARVAAVSSAGRNARGTNKGWLDPFMDMGGLGKPKAKEPPVKPSRNEEDAEKQGILNLLALLQARYKSFEAKRQLAILFSLITDPALQPSEQIMSLLGEADNASIGSIDLLPDADLKGYQDLPVPVTIEAPPALGAEYKRAKADALLRPTSRVLRVRVLDGGEGYTAAPKVTVLSTSGRVTKECEAIATLDRDGHVDSVVVLDPGLGYGGKGKLPRVRISGPVQQRFYNSSKRDTVPTRPATAVAELEYEVYGVNITEPGNGYVATQPPRVSIPPPAQETDWSVITPSITDNANAKVSQMIAKVPTNFEDINADVLNRIQKDPTALLPSSVRPTCRRTLDFKPGLVMSSNAEPMYYIPGLPAAPPEFWGAELPSPKYAAFDPIFGGVGMAPVTRGAVSLTAGQYTRLALSGAICTVIVRSLLNPLELIKTKIQIGTDEELILRAKGISTKPETNTKKRTAIEPLKNRQAQWMPGEQAPNATDGGVALLPATETRETSHPPFSDYDRADSNEFEIATSETKLGTFAVARSLVELRGPVSLFQSADITFLASLIFGGLGFGATELFRRAFTAVFFEEGSSDNRSQVILLGAAALATVITSLAATPFELTRVRSMGLAEGKGWKDVLRDILAEQRAERIDSKPIMPQKDAAAQTSILFKGLKKDDLKVLFAPFPKIVSRELPFALAKFLSFDIVAGYIVDTVNSNAQSQVQVGVGPEGLAISAFAGAIAGIAGAIVSHPADLILTLTSSASSETTSDDSSKSVEWQDVVKELLNKPGGVGNLFVGLLPRAFFFFLVIGSQFFLYDYVKNLLSVGSDDLSLVLDVFYAIRQGLLE